MATEDSEMVEGSQRRGGSKGPRALPPLPSKRFAITFILLREELARVETYA